MNVQDSEEVYVAGDFYGHVGRKSDGYERLHGSKGFGTRNASSETLLLAACVLDLAITNTWFKSESRGKDLIDRDTWLWNDEILTGQSKRAKRALPYYEREGETIEGHNPHKMHER